MLCIMSSKALIVDGSPSRASPNPIPFSPGIAKWWLRNSTAPNSAARSAGRPPVPWLCPKTDCRTFGCHRCRCPQRGCRLIERKIRGAEKGTLESNETEFHRREYESLVARLETEGMQSRLPDEPTCRDALNDLLVRVRLTPR
jgi:hypothetical protein